jgi:alkylation response protein AidB-like acyl-CoA dehydrogenase
MKRELYDEDHEAFRDIVRAFLDREVVDHLEEWEEAKLIDREVWKAAGEQGIIGLSAPEEYGGGGQASDYRYRAVVYEECAKANAVALGAAFSLQDDIVIPYINKLGTDEQKQRWLPAMVAGEKIAAVAMTEPGTGSDLRGIVTAARKVDGGWILNGSKTFISNGIHADLVVAVTRTEEDGGLSLLVVERGMDGFERGRKLEKMGMRSHDTAELFFTDVFVPDENLLGERGAGLRQLVSLLPVERLSIAAMAMAVSRATFAQTLDYVNDRKAFGRPIADFQNSRFVLAEIATELDVTTAFVDNAIRAHAKGDLTVVDAAKAKWWAADVQNRVVDRCLQLHGGYGYMLEYPVARAYLDSRVQKIYGGTNEIMKEIIGRDLIGRR